MARAHSALEGCLLGTAVGDALGLPREGLSASRANALYGPEIRYSFFRGKGWISDDTEQTIMVLQALRESQSDPEKFAKLLAKHLRTWFAMVPAGIGLATIRACLRLWIGIPPKRSGVPSAGNGAAMRSAIIGTWFADDAQFRSAFVVASTLITHTDERAIQSAQLVAMAAAHSAIGQSPDEGFWEEARKIAAHSAWEGLVPFEPPSPVSGYCVPTVRTALELWRRYPDDFEAAVKAAIRLGGDTDTVASIVGGIVGARTGVPTDLAEGIGDWPRDLSWLRRLTEGPTPVSRSAICLRNVGFLIIVLGHGFRRILPGRNRRHGNLP